MEVKWLVEDFEGDGALDPLISEIKSQGMQCEVVNYTPFQGGEYNQYSNEDCVVFYGSLNIARQLQREKPWVPGVYCNYENLCCLTYYSHWAKYLLNDNYIMLPMMEILRRREFVFNEYGVDNCIWIRPNSGAKTFTGQIVERERLDKEFSLFSNYAGKPLDKILAVISSPKIISKEWRCVIIDKKVIATSLYKVNDKLTEEEGCPKEVWTLAQKIANEGWRPDIAYTLDICLSNGKYSLIEVNSFSCSGFYKCNTSDIVKAISKAAIDEYNSYNDI